MIVLINDNYIETDTIEFISKIDKTHYSAVTTYQFSVFFKNRKESFVLTWNTRVCNGETADSLGQKVEIIRNKLARKITENVENLDATINLKKEIILPFKKIKTK